MNGARIDDNRSSTLRFVGHGSRGALSEHGGVILFELSREGGRRAALNQYAPAPATPT
jgi:hypothetical protein